VFASGVSGTVNGVRMFVAQTKGSCIPATSTGAVSHTPPRLALPSMNPTPRTKDFSSEVPFCDFEFIHAIIKWGLSDF